MLDEMFQIADAHVQESWSVARSWFKNDRLTANRFGNIVLKIDFSILFLPLAIPNLKNFQDGIDLIQGADWLPKCRGR